VVAWEWSAQVSLLGGSGLVARKRPNPGLGQEQSPKNFPGDQTTPHDKPKARRMVEGRSGPVRTETRRKAKELGEEEGEAKARWPY
jgi:hypothetical protein